MICRSGRGAGFTLIEMIVAIMIMGIVGGMVAVFIKSPIDSYVDAVRRAELTEEADAALRFVARDVQAALPNSILVSNSGATFTLTFLSIKSGGRFREYPKGDGSGTPLAFGQAVTGFDAIGAGAEVTTTTARGTPVTAPAKVVVGNLSGGATDCHSDATASAANSVPLSGLSGASVSVTSSSIPGACDLQAATVQDNPATAGANEANDRGFGKFYLVDSTPVGYSCGPGGLSRNGVALARHVAVCEIAFDVSSNALVQTVSIKLTLTRDGESVVMLRQIHVVNES